MIAVLGATKSCPVKCEQHRPGAVKTRSHTSNIVRRDWPRGFGALNSSLHSWIFTSVLVGSNPRSYLSTSATVWIPVHTAPKSDTEPIRYVTLHFRDRCGAASLRHKNRAPQPFLCVNRRLVAVQKLSTAVWTQAKTLRIQTILSLAPSGLRQEYGLKNTHWCLSTGFPNLVYVW